MRQIYKIRIVPQEAIGKRKIENAKIDKTLSIFSVNSYLCHEITSKGVSNKIGTPYSDFPYKVIFRQQEPETKQFFNNRNDLSTAQVIIGSKLQKCKEKKISFAL